MIDSLPYIMQLVKQNIILQALISTGSFQGVDLTDIKHDIRSNSAIEFFNFALGKDDIFDEALFYVTEDSTEGGKGFIRHLVLTTKDPKYFENSAYYFNDDENSNRNNHPLIKQMRATQKDLGVFFMFNNPTPPAVVSIIRHPHSSFNIFFMFYSNYHEVIKRKEELDKALENEIISPQIPKKNKKPF